MTRLIVDSTFGISKEYAEKNNIKIVNLKMVLDDVVTDEGFESAWGEYFERLATSKNFPTTSQPSPQDFIDAIEAQYKEDKNCDIIMLTIANSLSGTINAATVAAKSYPTKKIAAIDSQNASVGAVLLVEEIIDLISKGKTFEDLLMVIPKIQKGCMIQFVPQTLEYLKRGGRVGTLSAIMASVLNIKPIFVFKEGVVNVSKKVLGLGKALVDMIAAVPKNLKKIYICYIYDKINVQKMVEKVELLLGLKNVEIRAVSPVLGSHIGIGTVAIATLENY